ncbi:MAG: FAD-dependent monooxygenase [Kofleriaceae bacterium]|nr:FAD-dependent monooxygenase [Kofleriaceae bacterium]MCL4226569.1 FAD-dependent monooxygenase [Myxococcales bacterium]
MSLPSSVDVAIVGAGTSGAAAAWYFARAGARVVCVDRRPLAEAGARWVNGLTRTAMAEAGIELPPGAALGEPHPFHLVTDAGRVTVRDHDVVDVDMRALVALLQARAQDAGAVLAGDTAVLGRDGDALVTDRGRVRARWLVDASGLAGARLLEQPAVGTDHLCAAAQAVFEVRDRAAAGAWFAAADIPPGEIYARLGLAGGFSVQNVRLHHGGDTVAILTGSIPALGFPSGKAMLDRMVREQPWIGRRVFGGQGAIPLRRPYDRLARDNVALLGDAACQVFPAHGSGIGAGILAARLLAATLGGGGTLRDYEVAWHRRWGGLFAAYDAFRRWNQTMDPRVLDELMAAGVIDPTFARAGLDQTMPRLSLGALPPKARALGRRPRLVPGLARVAAQVGAAHLLSALYPRSEHRRLTAWSRGMARVLAV